MRVSITWRLLCCTLVTFCVAKQAAQRDPEPASSPPQTPLLSLGRALLQQAGKDIGSWSQEAADDMKKGYDKVDVGDTGQWVKQSGEDAATWSRQALENIKAKIDLTVIEQRIQDAATDLKKVIRDLDESGFQRFLRQASQYAGVDDFLNNLEAVQLDELPANALQYIKDNPGQTVFYVVECIVFIAPGAVYGPLFKLLGFGAGGVKAGSAAALLQKRFGGFVPAGCWFALVTSAQMDGYGVGFMDGAVRAVGAMAGTVKVAAEQIQPDRTPEYKERAKL